MHRMHRYIVNRVLLLIPTLIGRDVRFRGQSGKHLFTLSLTAADHERLEAWYHPHCMNDPKPEGHMASHDCATLRKRHEAYRDYQA